MHITNVLLRDLYFGQEIMIKPLPVEFLIVGN